MILLLLRVVLLGIRQLTTQLLNLVTVTFARIISQRHILLTLLDDPLLGAHLAHFLFLGLLELLFGPASLYFKVLLLLAQLLHLVVVLHALVVQLLLLAVVEFHGALQLLLLVLEQLLDRVRQ